MSKVYKYVLKIEFESEKPVVKHSDALIQFENGIGYFADCKSMSSINSEFIYGSGKTTLKKLKTLTKKGERK